MLFRRITLVFICSYATAWQAADFNATKDFAARYDCNASCFEQLETAISQDLESVGETFDYDFYATANNFSTDLQAGEVLKFQRLDANNYDVNSGTSLYKMQYTSIDIDGSVIPVTGFIALPQASFRGNNEKLRTVAYAHGTIGLYRGCAPSNGPRLYDYYTWQPLIQSGHAVVATDYAGLGNNYTLHKYLFSPTAASDVYYSVKAAQKVLGHVLSDQWMCAGHSQGGGACWKLAESHYVQNSSDFLGSVVIAPSTYIANQLLDAMEMSKNISLGYISMLHIGLKRAMPSYNGTFLSGTMEKRLRLAEKLQLCLKGMQSTASGLNQLAIINPVGLLEAVPILLDWQNATAPIQEQKSPRPILLIQGQSDSTIYPNTTEQAWSNACSNGNAIHLRLYEGQEHAPVTQASAPEWIGWISEVFRRPDNPSLSSYSLCTREVRGLPAGNSTKTSNQN